MQQFFPLHNNEKSQKNIISDKNKNNGLKHITTLWFLKLIKMTMYVKYFKSNR